MDQQEHQSQQIAVETVAIAGGLVPRVGRIAGTTPSGAIAVDFGSGSPKEAKLLANLRRNELAQAGMHGREVLLLFENGNPEKPVIVGLLADPLEELLRLEATNGDGHEPQDVRLDGKRLTLEAGHEIVLKCGEGSITLRKDGKIIIKGTHLLSRASGPNRIKGGSVQIN